MGFGAPAVLGQGKDVATRKVQKNWSKDRPLQKRWTTPGVEQPRRVSGG